MNDGGFVDSDALLHYQQVQLLFNKTYPSENLLQKTGGFFRINKRETDDKYIL